MNHNSTLSGSGSGISVPRVLGIPVLVAALGYLVDMYDLFLFNIVRVPSLQSLHLPSAAIFNGGLLLLNLQMAGLLIGGFVWGIMGDKRGRLSVLFGSILIYSLANIANGFVVNMTQYAVLRFIAGFGLAGELGAGITLVSEILPTKSRGYGTTLVATMGVAGALLAYVIAHLFYWKGAYVIGGCLGLLLMVFRIRIFESGIFKDLLGKKINRGDIRMLFANKTRALKYLSGIAIGIPIWYVLGILITFSPEFGKAKGLVEHVDAGKAVLLSFAAQVAGNLVAGSLSQYFQSRKKVVLFFVLLSFVFVLLFLFLPYASTSVLYLLCGCLGFCCGYWTLFITIGAELFGSNLRASVATTLPNLVRGSVIPLSFLFVFFKGPAGNIFGALIVGAISFVIALLALYYLEETFNKDLNYAEGD